MKRLHFSHSLRRLTFPCPFALALFLLASGCNDSTKVVSDVIQAGDVNTLKRILRSDPHLANAKDRHGVTPLHYAALWGETEAAKLLLQHQAAVNATNKDGKTPLHWTATCGNDAVAEVLLAHGANVRARDKWGHTPLHSVMVLGRQFKPSTAIAEMLLARGAEINARDNHDRTALSWAIALNHMEAARLLIAHGAEVDIFVAASMGDAHRVALLLAGDPSLACVTDFSGVTPLHWASLQGRAAVAELLLAQGADVNACDGEGRTPLHETPTGNQFAMTQLLIAHKADVNLAAKSGQTALQYAIAQDRPDIAYLLYSREVELQAGP